MHIEDKADAKAVVRRWTQEQYYEWDEATEVDPKAKIQNGGILWYTRRDPETGITRIRQCADLRWPGPHGA